MDKKEKIGKVTLDYEFYAGTDLYSDGTVEDELLDIVKNHEENEFGKIINEKNDWAILYHLSQVRQNIISWYPFEEGTKVLEVGAGCGAITGAIAEKAKKVDCVELSRKRSLINAHRNKNQEGITIKVGNFEEIEPHLDKDYDIITLIGVWEYAALYLSSDKPFHKFLKLLKEHIKPDGKIIIAIENKYGLKYWAGCREDHTGMFFEGIEGYTKTNGVMTFGKKTLENIFNEMGYESQFYYPYPDYKLPLQIFSDDYMPQVGMLHDNQKNLDCTRMVLFDEDKAFDSIIQDGMFDHFSNSYLIILTREKVGQSEDKVIYSKFENERSAEFRIRTDLLKTDNEHITLRKYPMNKKAVQHVLDIETLKNTFNDKFLFLNFDSHNNNYAEFSEYTLDSLEKHIVTLLDAGNKEKAKGILLTLVQDLKESAKEKFEATEEFRKIFGNCSPKCEDGISAKAMNILMEKMVYKNEKWNVFDGEWTFSISVPVDYIIFRLFNIYAPESVKQLDICSKCGIKEDEQKEYYRMEDHFIRYIQKQEILLEHSKIKKHQFSIGEELLEKSKIIITHYNQDGTVETDTDYFDNPDDIKINVKIKDGIDILQINPLSGTGIIHLKSVICRSGDNEYIPEISSNGLEMEKGCYLYDVEDPWIQVKILNNHPEYVTFELRIEPLAKQIIQKLLGSRSQKKWRDFFHVFR